MGTLFMIIFLFGSVMLLILAIGGNVKNKEDLIKDTEKRNEYIKNNNIPLNKEDIYCISKDSEDINDRLYAWIENYDLCLINANHINRKEGLLKEKLLLPLKNIAFYSLEGDYRVQQIIEGGGTSLTGAVIGGILAGGAGAIIGSRKKTETKEKEIDDRKTYLYYMENDEAREIVFNKDAYIKLKTLIPNKDIAFIEKEKKAKEITNKSNQELKTDDIYADIEKLSELKDKGILTEEEFNIKKGELLNRI